MHIDILTHVAAKLGYDTTDTPRLRIEAAHPPRQTTSGTSYGESAEITRVAPSPTGFMHIGTVYAALVSDVLAHQSEGMFYVRVEDTDRKREVPGADRLLLDGLKEFGLQVDASIDNEDSYGPYRQSSREQLYKAYVLDLLIKDRAYLCFATTDELQDITTRQNAQKVRPGYYGKWAVWRDVSDERVLEELRNGTPYIIRFKSLGDHEAKESFVDCIKGEMSMAQNDHDVPLLKSDGLPTYHLAHVVDDFLMKTTLVLRGDEWLPSTPLHFELCDALGIPRFRYAHLAPITIQDGSSKRKLSKRKDPQANVAFWLEQGYPVFAVTQYLFGLADSSYAAAYDIDHRLDPRTHRLTFASLSKSRSPLLDMVKVADYCKNHLADLSAEEFVNQYTAWASLYAPDQHQTIKHIDLSYLRQVVGIERGGPSPRKDVAKWSDVYEHYGYMIDDWFTKDFLSRRSDLLNNFSPQDVQKLATNFYQTFDRADAQPEWFDKLKAAATASEFCVDRQEFEANPEAYRGGLSDAAMIIRVLLTGKTRTPDLWEIMQVMPPATIEARLRRYGTS